MRAALFVALGALVLLCACTAPLDRPALIESRVESTLWDRVAVRAAEDPAGMARAVERSLEYVRPRPAGESAFGPDGPEATWGDLAATLEHLLDVLPRLGEDPDLLGRDFVWREVRPGPLMTGYYEPELEGSLTPDSRYPVPLYGRPGGLKSVDLGRFHPRWQGETLTYRVENGEVLPFYTREEIDTHGALNATETPVAWTGSLVDVFFLQVQGSGRLRLPDGSTRHVLYAGKNGHEYVSLGKVLIEGGHLPREGMSMQRIRQYLEAHPDLLHELLNTNPSYVFFRIAEDGPLGAMGRTLTPMVSVATDSAFLPLGSVLALEAELPRPDSAPVPTALLGLAQDRGGAITGSRLDLFCGAGEDAEFLAGHLKVRGRVFLLLKR